MWTDLLSDDRVLGSGVRQRTVALCCGALGCLALGALCCELLGRRRLFFIGGTLATLSPAALALCFGVPAAADSPRALQVVTAASTVVYLVAYNTALAALGWVVVVEALPLPYRAFGAGVAVGTRWLGAFAVAMSFRWLNTCAHRGPLALSCVSPLCLLGFCLARPSCSTAVLLVCGLVFGC